MARDILHSPRASTATYGQTLKLLAVAASSDRSEFCFVFGAGNHASTGLQISFCW
jgi:hypothetical protein